MEPFIVVVGYVVFEVVEASCGVFLLVCLKPAFYFPVGLWSVNAGEVVLYAHRAESDLVFVKLKNSFVVGRVVVVAAAMVGHHGFGLAVFGNPCFEQGKAILCRCVIENSIARDEPCSVVFVHADIFAREWVVTPISVP